MCCYINLKADEVSFKVEKITPELLFCPAERLSTQLAHVLSKLLNEKSREIANGRQVSRRRVNSDRFFLSTFSDSVTP